MLVAEVLSDSSVARHRGLASVERYLMVRPLRHPGIAELYSAPRQQKKAD